MRSAIETFRSAAGAGGSAGGSAGRGAAVSASARSRIAQAVVRHTWLDPWLDPWFNPQLNCWLRLDLLRSTVGGAMSASGDRRELSGGRQSGFDGPGLRLDFRCWLRPDLRRKLQPGFRPPLRPDFRAEFRPPRRAHLGRDHQAIDESLGRPLVCERHEQLFDCRCTQLPFHAQVRKQHLLERALLLRGLPAQLLHQRVRFRAPHFFGERERHRLRHDLTVGHVEIGAQALDVDLETLGDLDHGAERARGDERKRGERHPVGVPAARRPLMLLDLGGQQGRDEVGRNRRGRQRRRGCRPDCACAARSRSRRGRARRARTPRRLRSASSR